MPNRLQRFSGGIALFLVGEFLQTWIWPLAVTAGGVVIGMSQDVPLFYLYIAAVFLFSVSATGVLRFSEWRYRNSAADKLNFHSVRIDKALAPNGAVVALRIGTMFRNSALFPVAYELVAIETKLDNLYPPKQPYAKTAYTIPANGAGWFDDHYIRVPQKQRGSVEGELKLELNYGREGKPNNTLNIHKKLFFNFNDKGDIERISWIDQ